MPTYCATTFLRASAMRMRSTAALHALVNATCAFHELWRALMIRRALPIRAPRMRLLPFTTKEINPVVPISFSAMCFITMPMSRSVCYCARKKCMLVQTFFRPYFFAGLAVYCAMVSAILLRAMAMLASAAWRSISDGSRPPAAS
jgi:hypothetical protein